MPVGFIYGEKKNADLVFDKIYFALLCMNICKVIDYRVR